MEQNSPAVSAHGIKQPNATKTGVVSDAQMGWRPIHILAESINRADVISLSRVPISVNHWSPLLAFPFRIATNRMKLCTTSGPNTQRSYGRRLEEWIQWSGASSVLR